MKKLLLILLCLPMIGFGQNVNIPDANFKAYLVGNTAINTNGDTEIQVSEATAFYGTIYGANLGISDLTGIEDFTALINLYCDYNQLTSLDISQNTALITLQCSFNQLTTLDVSSNTALTNLNCTGNQLTSLDVSNNTALTYLYCSQNQLTNLDVSNNTALVILNCKHNNLTSLDVSGAPALTQLDCAGNSLASLDVRNGWNTNIPATDFDATNNPNLYCIDVDDAVWSAANWTYIDTASSFSNNCVIPPNPTWDCVASSCIDPGTGLGLFNDSLQCVMNCSSTGLTDLKNLNTGRLLKITDILGQETPYRRNTSLFYIYDDGTVEKKVILD
jgi:hypothetical protein